MPHESWWTTLPLQEIHGTCQFWIILGQPMFQTFKNKTKEPRSGPSKAPNCPTHGSRRHHSSVMGPLRPPRWYLPLKTSSGRSPWGKCPKELHGTAHRPSPPPKPDRWWIYRVQGAFLDSVRKHRAFVARKLRVSRNENSVCKNWSWKPGEMFGNWMQVGSSEGRKMVIATGWTTNSCGCWTSSETLNHRKSPSQCTQTWWPGPFMARPPRVQWCQALQWVPR